MKLHLPRGAAQGFKSVYPLIMLRGPLCARPFEVRGSDADLNNTTEHSSVILEPGQESSYRSSAVVLTPGTFSDEPHRTVESSKAGMPSSFTLPLLLYRHQYTQHTKYLCPAGVMSHSPSFCFRSRSIYLRSYSGPSSNVSRQMKYMYLVDPSMYGEN
ncbi:hypothetical protein BC629DRAFT_1727855 [Irpex lacteus]|nr:hypothetical protein BC629DRAFT_1727855 [Irpex lacteus]